MARILMENFEASDIKRLHGEGKKFSYLLEDDDSILFESTDKKLKEKVDKSKGFRISDDAIKDIAFEDYSDVYVDDKGKKYIKTGDKDNRSRDSYGRRIVTSDEVDAYINEFGINKMMLKKDIKIKKKNDKDINNG